jgi:CRISPR-associated protein Csm1
MVESAKVKKDQVLKIALAAFLHDIGKFAQRAEGNDKKPGIAAFYPSKEFIEGQQQRLQPFNKKFQNYTHKHAIYTAAFIDHLEKLLPECFKKENWGDKTWIGDLAAGHHFVKREDEDGFVAEWHNLERWVIAKADRLSSSLDREGFKNFETEYNKNQEIANFKSARLWPIIEAIKTHKTSTKESYNGGFKYRIPLNDLKDDLFFAKPADEVLPESKQNAVKEYQELFFRFIEELKGLEQFKHNVDLWFDQFENLYMRYAGQIPAATVSPAMQDISLYDHSKITAAIAVSLYLYHKETGQEQISDIENDKLNKLQFVGASFNGIQKFIFASGGSTNKAAAKILRGRSFYVSLLSETVGEMLMEETGLPPTSIVFNAAGQITLIAPNLPRIKEAVQRVRARTNDWLIKAYYGQTSVGFAQIATSQETIAMEYRQMWQNLSRAMEKEKFKKFDLSKYGGIQTQFFKNFKPELGICSFCGQRPAQNLINENETENYICNICQDQLEIGAKLVKSDAIAIWNKDEDVFNKNLKEPLFNKFQVWLGKLGEAIKMGKQGKLLKLARLSNSTSEPEWRKVAFKPIKQSPQLLKKKRFPVKGKVELQHLEF